MSEIIVHCIVIHYCRQGMLKYRSRNWRAHSARMLHWIKLLSLTLVEHVIKSTNLYDATSVGSKTKPKGRSVRMWLVQTPKPSLQYNEGPHAGKAIHNACPYFPALR